MEHETPTQEIFDEMKATAISIWESKNTHPGYLEEKMKPVNARVNLKDNAMVFYREFDWLNQREFRYKSSNEVLLYIRNNL